MRRGIAVYQSTSAQLWLPYVSGRLAEMLGRSGDVAEAAALCSQAIEQMESRGERCFEAELRRLRGSLWLSAGRPEEAKASLEAAIEVARRQQATSLELRATIELGRILQGEGRLAEAQARLAAIRGRMSEAAGSHDLEEGRALSEFLAGSVPAAVAPVPALPLAMARIGRRADRP
jgi:predicted ATPase